ncbi:hypothetical protein Cgig2_027459 [Carnegiea gigantea]|uniref:Uncharacterized protein n=1 Tax=Carnegiea gigantea TaxID=171969 RepID=A0A9Q1KNI3_9CARY|nr:hypothetical protein Cgig2_027459 [Carnegiea gigantea]
MSPAVSQGVQSPSPLSRPRAMRSMGIGCGNLQEGDDGLDGLTLAYHRQKGRPPPQSPSSHLPASPPSPLPVAQPLSFPLVQPLSETGLQKSSHCTATPTTQKYSNRARAQQPPRPQPAQSFGIRHESPSGEATGERQPHAGPTQSGRQRTQPSP